ncbi:hypothetical protein M514_21946 [Trichuris suis]|uniref:Uncharacterized protein n=1 Tax=Trichuris suis TaxID=68888 RepID=A0A085N8Q1_9BILA|nr:hypothetical protein M514_21946 [Trichuris suis]
MKYPWGTLSPGNSSLPLKAQTTGTILDIYNSSGFGPKALSDLRKLCGHDYSDSDSQMVRVNKSELECKC